MPDLLARSIDNKGEWQLPLPTSPIKLGRLREECDWAADWDGKISRWHATLQWKDGRLRVKCHEKATNAISIPGGRILPGEEFTISVGEYFQIGRTVFSLVETEEPDLPTPLLELTVPVDELRSIGFTDASKCIEALSDLPRLIRRASGDDELISCALDVMLRGLPRAQLAALVRVAPDSEARPELRQWRSRDERATFRPSHRLVSEAVRLRRQPVMHMTQLTESGSRLSEIKDSIPEDCNWAVCAPLPDEPEPGWALYAAGRLPKLLMIGTETARRRELQSDLRFTKLVADFLGALRQLRVLRGQQAVLESLLSSQVVDVIKRNPDLLKARPADVTVLFCDLRGSCRITEQSDDLPLAWERVSEALQFMTAGITAQDGVIGDFQGDAAMGFWGWPLAHDDNASRAAHAALDIQRDFQVRHARPGSAIADFRTGIGIASGRAFAGFLGTEDQKKVSVFGSVVNLAARLESLTKALGVSILLDEATALALRGQTEGWARLRKLARIRPYGMQTAHVVYELLPPDTQKAALHEPDRLDYEAAVESFLAGRWNDARDLLEHLADDGPSRFVLAFMTAHQNKPPAEWTSDPTIVMHEK